MPLGISENVDPRRVTGEGRQHELAFAHDIARDARSLPSETRMEVSQDAIPLWQLSVAMDHVPAAEHDPLGVELQTMIVAGPRAVMIAKIGRASCRERV